MKKLALLLTGLLTACSVSQMPAAPPAQNNTSFQSQNATASTLRFMWRDEAQLTDLVYSGFDVFGVNHQTQTAEARLSAQEMKQLQAMGVPFQVAARNMEPKGFPSGYMTYQQMAKELQAIARENPELVRLEDVGDTWEKTQGKANHDIWQLTLGTAPANAPAIMMVGGTHARELAPVEVLMKLTKELLSRAQEPEIAQLLKTKRIVIIPMLNVDGRVQVERGNLWHRKNTHGAGVDINRNYDFHWNFDGLDVPSSWKRGLNNPNGQIYSGTHPASEPETQAIQAAMARVQPSIFVDMHAHGEMMLWAFGYSKEDIPDAPRFKRLYSETVQKIGFRGGTSAQILYPTAGTTRDYAHGRHGAISMTLEIGRSFHPSYPEVENIYSELKGPLLTMISKAGAY